MNQNYKVYSILVFGLITSLLLPHIVTFNNEQNLKNEKPIKNINYSSSSNSVAIAMPDQAVPVVAPKQEQPKQETLVKQEQPKMQPAAPVIEAKPIVFDGLTMEELTNKLNKSLRSTLSGTGASFAKYAVEMGIDPYLAIGIVLLETGCNGTCSKQVQVCNNVGGMKGSPGCNGTSYKYFESLDAGIYSFMVNLKTNYYDKGLTTAELMNRKYATSQTWATKVNRYANQVKAA